MVDVGDCDGDVGDAVTRVVDIAVCGVVVVCNIGDVDGVVGVGGVIGGGVDVATCVAGVVEWGGTGVMCVGYGIMVRVVV